MGRWKIYLPLAIVAPGLATWLGFHREEQRLEMGDAAPLSLRTTLKRIFVRPPDSVARLNDLRSRAGRVGLSPQDAAECWQIIRGFDVEQVKSYLAELPASDNSRASDTLTGMLFSRWAQIDPVSAADGVLKLLAETDRYRMQTPLRAVLATWLSRDPEAALNWAGTERPEQGDIFRFAGAMAGGMFVRQDPLTALDRAASQYPFALTGVLTALALRGEANEENRQQFFDLSKNLHDNPAWTRAATQLARAWGRNDPAGALNSTGQYDMSPEQLATFRKNILETVSTSNPVIALDWMQKSDAEGSASLRASTYRNLAYREPQEATDWAVKNGQFDLIGETVKNQSRWSFGWQRDTAEAKQLFTGLRIQYQAWQQHQPDDAGQWAATLPADLRENITAAPAADATH